MSEHPSQQYDDLIRSAAQRLSGHPRRLFQAEVANALCGGSPRAAERRFGWGRDSVETGLHEARSGLRCVENFAAKGAVPREVKDSQLAADIRAMVEPHTQADPELKSSRRYTNLSAREVLEALKSQKGYSDDRLPKERDHARHPQPDGLPAQADPEGQAAEEDQGDRRYLRQRARGPPGVRRRPRGAGDLDRHEGEGQRGGLLAGGKKPDRLARARRPRAWDHDPPAETKWTPFGVLMLATGALTLIFTRSRETSDFWADALKMWWRSVKGQTARSSAW